MTSSGTSSQLLDVAERIADGADIDWSQADGIEPELLACLRAVEALAGRTPAMPPPVEPRWLAAGARFAGLEIVEPIGSGSSGVVYRAHDPVLGRDVALKLCAPSADHSAALLREARKMARVDHPGVLRVHGAVEEAGVVGFWSDLIAGESLETWSNAHPRPGAGELAVIGLELCAALAAIHADGLIHGDIKPGNVIRHASGRWVLVDFGSSSVTGDAVATTGTPLYLAPELFDGAKPAVATDIYALGVLMFRLASGRFPVEANEIGRLRDRHRSEERARLMDLRPDLPPALIAAIENAIAPSLPSRHRSVGEFAHALDAAIPRATAKRTRRFALAGAALLVVFAIASPFLRPSASVSGAPRIQLHRVADGSSEPLRDGDAIAPGDGLSLSYRYAEPAHVYVVNEDGTGATFQLFPLGEAAMQNPLPANVEVRLPGRVGDEAVDWQVTSRGGDEHFYIVVSPEALPSLTEHGLVEAGSASDVLHGALAMDGFEPTRGASGLRPSAPTAGASPFAKWLDELERTRPDIHVRRIDLRNP